MLIERYIMKNRNLVILLILIVISNYLEPWSFFGSHPEPQIPVEPIKKIAIMLDPAGDSCNPGRTIEDHYERGISLMCAQQIKQLLESRSQNIEVLITRSAGEQDEPEPFQNISFANKIQVNLYISLNFFYTLEEKSKIWIYYLSYNPVTDYWDKKQEQLSFYPYNTVHTRLLDTTKQIGLQLLDSLKKSEKQTHVIPQGLFGIPFRPLAGLTSCALAFEISLPKKNSWKNVVESLVSAIESTVGLLEAKRADSV